MCSTRLSRWSRAGWRRTARRRPSSAQTGGVSGPSSLERDVAVVGHERPLALVGFGHEADRYDPTGLFAEQPPVVLLDVARLLEPFPQLVPTALDGDHP